MVLIKTATDSEENANKIVKALIEPKLCACCQVYQVNSTYWWEGKIVNQKEWVVEARTNTNMLNNVFEKIREIHTYELPEILAIAVAAEDQYTTWAKEKDQYNNGPKLL